MNLQQFIVLHKDKKSIDQVTITCINGNQCVHPDQPNIKISKAAAIKNFRKHNNNEFKCGKCDLHYDNPMNKIGHGKRSKEELNKEIEVICPICFKIRKMKVSSYTGSLNQEPFLQIDGSCAQKGKVISEEQKEAIRKKLKGITRSDEFKQKISEYMRTNEEGIERGRNNLVPGFSGGWNEGLVTPPEVREKQSQAMIGKPKTLEHRHNISVGRKKMLQETGGFTNEHRENISKATILQIKKGFNPKLHHLKGWHYSPKINKHLFHKSSYEKRAFMILDSDENVLSYEWESVTINYFNPIKQINSNYLVDAKVKYKDLQEKWIEIKPAKWLSENNKNSESLECKAKVQAAINDATKLNIPFEIWSEIILFGKEDTIKKMKEFNYWLKSYLLSEEYKNYIEKCKLPNFSEIKYTKYEKRDKFKQSLDDFLNNYSQEIYNILDTRVQVNKNEKGVWLVLENKQNSTKYINFALFIFDGENWINNVFLETEETIATSCPLELLTLTSKEVNPYYSDIWRESVKKFWENYKNKKGETS